MKTNCLIDLNLLNEIGDPCKFNARLHFFSVPPQISPDIKTNVEVDEGSDVTLKCKATGRPKPEITWRHLVPSGKIIHC